MTYQRPEVLALGNASAVILGTKQSPPPENNDFTKNHVSASADSCE